MKLYLIYFRINKMALRAPLILRPRGLSRWRIEFPIRAIVLPLSMLADFLHPHFPNKQYSSSKISSTSFGAMHNFSMRWRISSVRSYAVASLVLASKAPFLFPLSVHRGFSRFLRVPKHVRRSFGHLSKQQQQNSSLSVNYGELK